LRPRRHEEASKLPQQWQNTAAISCYFRPEFVTLASQMDEAKALVIPRGLHPGPKDPIRKDGIWNPQISDMESQESSRIPAISAWSPFAISEKSKNMIFTINLDPRNIESHRCFEGHTMIVRCRTLKTVVVWLTERGALRSKVLTFPTIPHPRATIRLVCDFRWPYSIT
jgi:hypothetical protein